MSETLFGGASTVADVSRQLEQIVKSLDKLQGEVRSTRNANITADAIVMPKECPAGLVGCNAKELYEKTGGELTCPPLEQAPDPLIVDYKGRVCYAPESLKEQWKDKSLNVRDLMEKYALKLVKMLESGQNLATAIEFARKGPQGAPIILNAYTNNKFVKTYVETVIGGGQTEKEVLAGLLSRFSDGLEVDSGARLMSQLLNNGEQVTCNVLFSAVIACSKETSKKAKLQNAINSLAYVMQLPEFQPDDVFTNQMANSMVFLPAPLRKALGSEANPVQQFRELFALTINMALLEGYGGLPTKFTVSLKALRDARTNADKAQQDAKAANLRKEEGETVLSEEAKAIEAREKAAVEQYVARCIDFAATLCEDLGVKFSDGPAPRYAFSIESDPFVAARRAMIAALDAQVGPDQSAFNAAFTPFFGASRGSRGSVAAIRNALANEAPSFNAWTQFVDGAVKGSKTARPYLAAFGAQNLLPVMSAATIQSGQGAEQFDLARKNALASANKQAFCAAIINGETVYLASDLLLSATDAQAAVDAVKTAQALFKNGDTAKIVDLINRDGSKIVRSQCAPVDDSARVDLKYAFLTAGDPVTELFVEAYPGFSYAANPTAYDPSPDSGKGLLKAQRDAYAKLKILLWAVAGQQYMLLASQLKGKGITWASVLGRAQKFPDAALGNRLGGGEEADAGTGANDLLVGGNEFDTLEDVADFFLTGGATQAHTMPKEISKFVNAHSDLTAAEEAQRKKLKEKGYDVTFFKTDKCPAYLKGTNNTFGTPGEKKWVETKSMWPKCMEQMGFQFVTQEGYCYPYGMTCYPEDDIKTATIKTVDTVDNWIQLARVYNSVQQRRYQEWLEGEKARIRSEPQNANMPDAEVEKLAKSFMPPEFAGVPQYGAVQTLVTLSADLENSVSELTSSSDAAQREALKRVLKETNSLREQWFDDDKAVERSKLDKLADKFVSDAKKCTDTSIAENGKPVPNVTATAGCKVLAIGEKDKILIPDSINAFVDTEKISAGDPVDPLVQWWRKYYQARAKEEAKKIEKVASKISPFEVVDRSPALAKVPKPAAEPKTAQAALEDALQSALSTKGLNMALRR